MENNLRWRFSYNWWEAPLVSCRTSILTRHARQRWHLLWHYKCNRTHVRAINAQQMTEIYQHVANVITYPVFSLLAMVFFLLQIVRILSWLYSNYCGFVLWMASIFITSSQTFYSWTINHSERQIPDLAKLFLSADQINLYFIQLFVSIWPFCGTY